MSVRYFKVCVCVHYGSDKIEQYRKKLAAVSYFDRIFFVDTSCNRPGINDFYEFSGYQYGLDKLCFNNFPSELNFIRIVFVNDTFFNTHVPWLAMMLLKKVTRVQFLLNSVSGVSTNFDKKITHLFNETYFFSTWFFFFDVSVSSEGRLSLFNRDVFPPDFVKSDTSGFISSLDLCYLESIKEWIYPKSIFSGWYKSPFFYPVSDATFLRKSLCIFLEHSMLGHLRSNGLKLRNMLDIGSSNLIKLFLLIDRLYINFHKIIYRAACYFKS